jgi:hypothetical protein
MPSAFRGGSAPRCSCRTWCRSPATDRRAVGAVANVEHLESGSAPVNIAADTIRPRLAQDGHPTTEIRLRRDIGCNRGDGECLVSRNRRGLIGAPAAASAAPGTNATSCDNVYVSIKLLSAIGYPDPVRRRLCSVVPDVDGLLHTQDT